MTRLSIHAYAFTLAGVLACSTCSAQSPGAAASQNPSGAPQATSTRSPNSAANAPDSAKKPKKVWTNDDVNGLKAPISVVGDSKHQDKTAADAKADGQYIANTRKQLQKLQSQLDDTNQQLTDLQNFKDGKEPATSGAYQFNKEIGRAHV